MAITVDFRLLTVAEQSQVGDILQKVASLKVEKAKVQTARAAAESGFELQSAAIDAEIHKLEDELSYMREATITEK